MPIKKNLSDLPHQRTVQGNPPRKPRVVTAVAEQWEADWKARPDFGWGPVIPDAGPYRGSMASLRCNRQLQYALLGINDSENKTVADFYRLALGTMVHDVFQKVMVELFEETATAEHPIDLREIGIPGSMRVDLVQNVEVEDPETQVSTTMPIPVELKTINGFGFKQAATTFKGPPKGPRSGHELQLAFAIVALDAPYGVLGYLSLENVGPDLVQSIYSDPTPVQQFAAEWIVHRDDAEYLVETERRRITRLLEFMEAHPDQWVPRELCDPEYPSGALVRDPSRGTWVTMLDGKPTQTGKAWQCAYCDNRDRCIEDGAGYITETEVQF